MARLPLLLFTLVLVTIAATHGDNEYGKRLRSLLKAKKGFPRYRKQHNSATSATPSLPNTECGMLPADGFSKRIIGGQTAAPHKWPSICRLRVVSDKRPIEKYERGLCGSILVKNKKGVFYVITAAHCLHFSDDPNDYTVRCGVHNLNGDLVSHEQVLKVKSMIVHNGFVMKRNPLISFHDIAVLKLSTQPAENSFVQAACLPTRSPKINDSAVVVGWGKIKYQKDVVTSANELQELVKPVISANECENLMNAGGKAIVDCDKQGNLCAGHTKAGKGACKGDSGGPLYTRMEGRWTLIGVVSFGIGCAQENRVGVYADVFRHLEWINDKINN